MNILKSFFLGTALLLTAGTASATGNIKVNVIPVEKNVAVVQVLDITENIYEIELMNQDGDLIFYKATKSPSSIYSMHYDFSMLNDGLYNLTVKTDKENMENIIRIHKGNLDVVTQRKEVKPYFTINNNRLEVSWLNFGMENIKIKVYEDNNLLYEKRLDKTFTINYGLDISNLKNGNYYAILMSDNNSFRYNITEK